MRPVILVDVVGLTPRDVERAAPAVRALGQRGALAPMDTVLPAVTCPAQATLLTGQLPAQHGIVANGYFDRETGEIRNWPQSNGLVKGRKLYETVRSRWPGATCAKLFWWFNQGAAVDFSITPKPWYHADGRKTLDVYAAPSEFGRDLVDHLGPFPFLDFWGPRSGLPSSRWIASAAIRTLERRRPTLTLVYLPHLDYAHQRFGPDDPRSVAAVREVDALCGELFAAAERAGAEVVVVSEYGIRAVSRPVLPNRALRRAGLLAVREGPVGELLDPFASRAFALCEHQVAHVYLRSPEDEGDARAVLERLDGVERVLDREALALQGLAHPRAGDLVLVSEPDAWFAYPHWLDDARAPDFARTVDIHRKTGFDPCELFVDPALRFPRLRVARRLAQKLLGLRYTMDVVPLDPTLVRGSHGRPPETPDRGPVFACSRPFGTEPGHPGPPPERTQVAMTSVAERVLNLLAG